MSIESDKREEEERRVFICGFWKGINAEANPNLRGKSLGEIERQTYEDWRSYHPLEKQNEK